MVKIRQNQLTAIWAALQRPLESAKDGGYRFDIYAALKDGWVKSVDLEDAIYSRDSRLAYTDIDLEELAVSFGQNWTLISNKPKAISNEVASYRAIRLPELVSFKIFLKSLGFEIEAKTLINDLLPEIKAKQILTDAELDVFCHEKLLRNSFKSIQVSDRKWEFGYSKKGKFENGYKFDASFRPDGSICLLEIKSPTFRKIKEPTLTKCSLCGHTWLKGNPEESANHRKIHKRRMSIVEPTPNENMILAFRTENDPELVECTSPHWKHNEMLDRAFAFKREMGFDFPQWTSAEDAWMEEDVFGFLFTHEDGKIIGSAAFRYQNSNGKEEAGFWYLDWVWVAPCHRRNATLTKRWAYFKDRFGEFYVSHPLSDAMKKFLGKMNDDHLSLLPSER